MTPEELFEQIRKSILFYGSAVEAEHTCLNFIRQAKSDWKKEGYREGHNDVAEAWEDFYDDSNR